MDDYISREGTIKAFCEKCRGYYDGHCIHRGECDVDVIQNAPSCVPQWISVKDRMPEKHGWYLTAHKKTYPTDSGMQVCFFCHGRFMVDKKIKITHWKPLPEYPESEEKSE